MLYLGEIKQTIKEFKECEIEHDGCAYTVEKVYRVKQEIVLECTSEQVEFYCNMVITEDNKIQLIINHMNEFDEFFVSE